MTRLAIADLPPLTGSPGMAQGSYGDVGNLELLVPAAGGGLEVFWFNADAVEHRHGAARGCWSGALHVFGHEDVRIARISQVAAGPRFLEALAVTRDGSLHRLYWTPTDGFVAAGILASDVIAASAVVEAQASLHLLAVHSDGTVVQLHAPLTDYPTVTWRTRRVARGATAVALGASLTAAVLVDGAARVMRYDGDWQLARTVAGPWTDIALAGELVLGLDASGQFAGVPARALTAARTTLDGGRIDVVLAVDRGLVHLHGDGHSWSAPRRIRSEVWIEPGGSVHR